MINFKKFSASILLLMALAACQTTQQGVHAEVQQMIAPKSLAGSYLVARQAQKDRNWQVAAQEWTSLLEYNAKELNVDILNKASLTALGAGDYDLASTQAKMTLEKSPDNLSPFDRLLLVSIALHAEDIELAQTVLGDIEHPAFKQLVVPTLMPLIDVENPNLMQNVAEALAQLAQLFQREERYDSALLFARLSFFVHDGLEGIAILLGDILATSEQYDQARDAYAAEPEISPYYMKAQILVARMQHKMNRSDAAIDSLKKLLKVVSEEEKSEVYAELASTYRNIEAYKDAIEAYTAFVLGFEELPQKFYYAYFMRGASYERLGKWDKAEEDLLLALEHFPENPDILNYLGYGWIDRGLHLDKAEAMIRKAIELRPDDGHITDSLGWALYKEGRYQEAVEILERAVELEPYDPIINDHLGDAYWQVGRHQEARFQWLRALNYKSDVTPDIDRTDVERKLAQGLTGL